MQLELGRPVSFSATTPATQTEIHGHRNEGVFVNGYRIRKTLSKVESKLCVILGPEYTGKSSRSILFAKAQRGGHAFGPGRSCTEAFWGAR